MQKSQVVEREMGIIEDNTSEAADIQSKDDGKDESEEAIESEVESENGILWHQDTGIKAEEREKKRDC
jgi:hypothetical protein